MNVCSKYFLTTLCLLSAGTVAGVEHVHDDLVDSGQPSLVNTMEPFQASMTYDIVLGSTEAERTLAKSRRKAMSKSLGSDAVISKSNSEKSELFAKISLMLPANTVFRIVSANDNEEGDVLVRIDTKDILPVAKMTAFAGANSIKEYGYVPTTPQTIYRQPGESTKSLPAGWTKEEGFQSISGSLTGQGSDSTLKVSIVFDNSEKVQFWINAPYAKTIENLMSTRRGEVYGLSDLEADEVWWTQEITLSQAQKLFSNPLVINLIPRI